VLLLPLCKGWLVRIRREVTVLMNLYIPQVNSVLISLNFIKVRSCSLLSSYSTLDEWAQSIGRMMWQQRKTKALGESQAQSHFFHHKSHTDLPGIEIRPPWWQIGDSPPKPWNGLFAKKNKALFYFDSFQMLTYRFSSTLCWHQWQDNWSKCHFKVLLQAVVDISL